MGTKDPRVDAYIEKSAEFAQPILTKLRKLVHKGCPDVTETIKWGMPMFEYNGPLGSMAAFKQHCAFGFWKAALLHDGKHVDAKGKSMSWGAAGRDGVPAKITSMDDLPSDAAMLRLLKKAAKLNDDGVNVPRSLTKKKPLPMPDDLAAALKRTKGAKANFDAFTPSQQREYIEWITEAKREDTRSKRIATAVQWIAEGKTRNWKYQKK